MLRFLKFVLYLTIFSILSFKFITFYYLSQGDKYFEKKEYEKAIIYYEKAKKITKERNVYYNLANLYYKINNLEKAIENIKEFLKYKKSADVYHLLAIFYYEKDDLKNAERYCSIAAALDNSYIQDLNLIRNEKEAEDSLTCLESENFIIKFNTLYEETSAKIIREILEKIHAKISPLELLPQKEKTTVKIYDSLTFEKITSSSANSNYAAVINNKIFLHSPGFFLINKNMEEILTHEYVHLIIQRLVKGNIPVYLNEGIAELFSEGELSEEEKLRLKKIYMEGKIIPFTKLRKRWDRLNKEEREIAYLQSKYFVEYLVKNFGWEILGKLIKEFSKEGKEKEVFKKLTGKNLKTLEEEFKKYIKLT